MTNLYAGFVASIAAASDIALKIAFVSLFAVVAYHCLDFLPASWRPVVKFIAWIYALLIVAGSIYFSMGISS